MATFMQQLAVRNTKLFYILLSHRSWLHSPDGLKYSTLNSKLSLLRWKIIVQLTYYPLLLEIAELEPCQGYYDTGW